MRVVDQME